MSVSLRIKYRQRLVALFKIALQGSEGDDSLSPIELQAHWSKYLCVLTSGYLEQSFKEILLNYAKGTSHTHVSRGIDNLWPKSKNMKLGSVIDLLGFFSPDWREQMEKWSQENDGIKSDINSLIEWRNNISHGNDANTTNVTMSSVKTKFDSVNKLLDQVEMIVAS